MEGTLATIDQEKMGRIRALKSYESEMVAVEVGRPISKTIDAVTACGNVNLVHADARQVQPHCRSPMRAHRAYGTDRADARTRSYACAPTHVVTRLRDCVLTRLLPRLGSSTRTTRACTRSSRVASSGDAIYVYLFR